MSHLDYQLDQISKAAKFGSADTRRVQVSMRVSYYLTSNLFSNGFDNIQQILTGNGWDIVSVDALSRSYYPTEPLDILITANVKTEFSDQEIIGNLKTQLAGLLQVINAQVISRSAANDLQDKIINSTNAGNVPDSDFNINDLSKGILGITAGTFGLLAIAGIVILPLLLRKK
jgi:hypothetical protein